MASALIAGASGLIGRRLVALCRDDPRYEEVHVLTRRPLSLGAAGGVVEHVVDFERLTASELAVTRVDDVYCALGTTLKKAGSKDAFRRVDHDYVLALGQLALELDARRFLLVSSWGADPRSPSFYQRVKGETETDLAALGLTRLLIFRPSLLVGSRGESRPVESFAGAVLGLAGPLVPRRLRPVADHVLARAMLRAADEETASWRVYDSEEIQTLGAT